MVSEEKDQEEIVDPAEEVDEGDQFEALLSDYLETMPEIEVGQLVKAKVVAVNKDSVLLDVGDKAEGTVDVKEFADWRGNVTVKEGDEVEIVVQSRDSESGNLICSHRNAMRRVHWNSILAAHEGNFTVRGIVTKALKNGVLVDAGIPCFMPASQLDLGRVEDLNTFVGKEVEAFVIDVDRHRHRAVLSRRKFLAEEQNKKRSEVIDSLEVDTTVSGKVKSIVEFGVFVDLGGIDGLVPRDEIAWEKHVNIAETLRLNTHYKFKVLAVDKDRQRITLSRKQIKPDPWLKVQSAYPLELVVKATVINITGNCAYVQLEDGLEGRIQREDLSWALTVRKPGDVLKKNDGVKAVVLGYDDEKRLLKLGLKQISTDPWAEIEQKYPVGSTQKVKVLEVVPYGVFVQLDETTKGLIHVSDMSWDRGFKNPKKLAEVGQEIDAVVLKLDLDNRRINLGIKQLTEDPFAAFLKKHPKNSHVTGTVKSVTSFGVFVELAPQVEGLLHISQWSREKVENLEQVVKPGDEVTVKIIKVEAGIQKLSLSRKAHLHDEERREVDQYKHTVTQATTSLGSLLSGLKIDVKE